LPVVFQTVQQIVCNAGELFPPIGASFVPFLIIGSSRSGSVHLSELVSLYNTYRTRSGKTLAFFSKNIFPWFPWFPWFPCAAWEPPADAPHPQGDGLHRSHALHGNQVEKRAGRSLPIARDAIFLWLPGAIRLFPEQSVFVAIGKKSVCNLPIMQFSIFPFRGVLLENRGDRSVVLKHDDLHDGFPVQ